jgi:adenylate cyclase
MQLAGRLRMSGLDVWLHEGAIQGADQWSKEIVDAIEACKVFLLVLSQESFASKHVLSELSIASESERTILPIEIGELTIPNAFRYQLAGIQRTQISDFEGILRSLNKLGFGESRSEVLNSVSPDSGTGHRTSITDPRKSLIVLPFEDLSPSNDNGWFADGLMSELIESLAKIKSLRLIDRKTSMDLKGFRGKTMQIADAMQVRYFIEGNVRKFGDQIKISVQLLDIETGEYLWQDSHRGTFKDIFDIQESVANKVVEGLRLHLTKDEEETTRLELRGTSNPEAYELFLKAREYFSRSTKQGFQLALQLQSDAITLDPDYALAYVSKANALNAFYSQYDRDPKYLSEAEECIKVAFSLKPNLLTAYYPLSTVYWLQGKLNEAEETTAEFIRKAPEYWGSYFARGFFYMQTGQFEKAISPFAEAVRLNPAHFVSLWNLVVVCDGASERAECAKWAGQAIPYCEQFLKLNPDDESMQVKYASLLHFAGRIDEARVAARNLRNVSDGASLYNAARLLGLLGEPLEALTTLQMAIEAGFGSVTHLQNFLDEESIIVLNGAPEFKAAREMIEQLQLEQRALSGAQL